MSKRLTKPQRAVAYAERVIPHEGTLSYAYERARVVGAYLAGYHDAEHARELAGMAGKCFKYRNCYPRPQSEADRWWAYQIVTEVDGGTAKALYVLADECGQPAEPPAPKMVGVTRRRCDWDVSRRSPMSDLEAIRGTT